MKGLIASTCIQVFSMWIKVCSLISPVFHPVNKKYRRFIAHLLIFTQFFQLTAALAIPLPTLSSQTGGMAPFALATSGSSSSNSNQNGDLSSLSLSNEDMGLNGPLSLGVTYSDLTHTFLNAKYVLPLNEQFAIMGLGEYGADQYRFSGTLGYGFSPLAQIKFSAERLGQRLPFQFDSGNIEQNVSQNAYGLRFQQLFIQPFLQSFNAGAYYAKAANKDLAPVTFFSNGDNCGGYEAGLACINYRYLVGAMSSGADIGAEILLTPSSLVGGNIYYDDVRYDTQFAKSNYNQSGIGGSIKVNQLITNRLQLTGEASVRKIYDTYQGGLTWLVPIGNSGMELSLFGQHLVSHNTIPDNNSINLKFSWLLNGDKRYDERFRWDNKQLTEVAQWVKTPAVYMEQVLIAAEQVTRLLGPAIIAITPNNGFFAGGNVVTITGSNFVNGVSVFIGDQIATAVTVISPVTITATVPAATPIPSNNLTVDVTVQNPDGQKAVLSNGYIYSEVPPPVLINLTPVQGPDIGGTVVTVTGDHLINTSSVTFDGIPATSVTPVNDTTVTAVTPSHAPGTVDVIITSPSGSSTLPNSYTYLSTLSSTNPVNATRNVGQSASFSTITSGGTTPYTYQWQISTNGGSTFTDVSTGSGGTTATYTTGALALGDNNNQYRVLVTDAVSDTVTTAAAVLTVNTDLSSSNPADATRNVGQTASFSTITSGGTTPYTYQWQISSDGGSTFTDVSTGSGGTTATYTTGALALGDNNNQYRVLVTDAVSDTVTTAAAVLTVNTDLSSSNPADATRNVGQTASFSTITSGGTTPYVYQWQISTNGGSTFTDVSTGSGGTTATYTTGVLALGDNNNQYRVLVTDAVSDTVTTAAAVLTVNPDLTSSNPADATRNVGQTASFSTITSGGTTPYVYQWQISTNGGSTFTNVSTGSGGTTATYTTGALALGDNNNQYRVLVTDAVSDTVTTAAAVLTVNPDLTSTNPANITSHGEPVNFSTTTSGGTPPYAYQWQVSTDGGATFSNVTTGTGANTATYTTTSLTTADNNQRYRVLVTDAATDSVTTGSALLTVLGSLRR